MRGPSRRGGTSSPSGCEPPPGRRFFLWSRHGSGAHTFRPPAGEAATDTLLDHAGNIDLRRATLIHVNTASEDWQTWLDATASEGIEPSGGLRFDTIQLALEAAATGLGVAMGRRPLVDADIAAHTLVEASAHGVASETAYWLVSAQGADDRPDLLGFKRWLIEEARAFDHHAPSHSNTRPAVAR